MSEAGSRRAAMASMCPRWFGPAAQKLEGTTGGSSLISVQGLWLAPVQVVCPPQGVPDTSA